MIDKQLIIDAVNEAFADPSWFLVEVVVAPGNIITVEIDNDKGVGIDDCARLSRLIESRLNRDEEDFELEVGSAGLTSPFKIPRQYAKNKGNEVETLTKDGRKLYGVLKDNDDEKFVLTIAKQVKPEGAKRKITVEEDLTFGYGDVKYTKYLIRFK
jgi:ribosome maturation factor RimP